MVDEDGAVAERLERAVWPERHRAEIVVIADAGEDEIGAVAPPRPGWPPILPPNLRDPGFGLGAGAVEDRDVVAATRLEMAGHGKAHDAEPDPGDFAHGPLRYCDSACIQSPA